MNRASEQVGGLTSHTVNAMRLGDLRRENLLGASEADEDPVIGKIDLSDLQKVSNLSGNSPNTSLAAACDPAQTRFGNGRAAVRMSRHQGTLGREQIHSTEERVCR